MSHLLCPIPGGDDAALLARTREGAEAAIQKYMEVASDFGLTVSVPKTKLMVSGREATAEDKAPITAGDEQVENVRVLVLRVSDFVIR